MVVYSSDMGVEARSGMERVLGRERPLNVEIRMLTIWSAWVAMLRVFRCVSLSRWEG